MLHYIVHRIFLYAQIVVSYIVYKMGKLRLIQRTGRQILNFVQLHFKSILIGILVGLYILLYLDRAHKENIITAKDREKEQVLAKISDISNLILKNDNIGVRDKIKWKLELGSSAVLMGGERGNISSKRGDVCPEKYLGNQFWPYQFESWVTQECDYGKQISDLVTVYVEDIVSSPRFLPSLHNVQPNIRVISNCRVGSIAGVLCLGEIVTTKKIKSALQTKYLLYGADLEYFTDWANLTRAVRLISESEGVFAVSGASRNTTGHWSTSCFQVTLDYYRLQVLEGYKLEYNDCMVCDYAGGPVLVSNEHIIPDDIGMEEFLLGAAISKKGIALVCPDIMFFTRRKIGKFDVSEASVKGLAKRYNFQGVVLEKRYKYEYQFECEDLGNSCDIRSQAAEILVPWCCVESFRYILNTLEYLRAKYKTHYEIESGTLLGAVKLGNFIPWDIDMDLAFKTADFDLFRSTGQAAAELSAAEIQLYNYHEDMYHVKGAGMFFMWYKGIMAEMLGDKNNLSLNHLPEHLYSAPTLVQVGPELWVPAVANPGLYIRGRYGPGYLYHVQSWRHAGLASSYDKYSPAAWQPCSDPTNQACLINYPIIGNIELGPYNYP